MPLETLSGVPSSNESPLSSGLGDLGQAARKKQLNTARWVLIFLGFITVLFNGMIMYAAGKTAEQDVHDALVKKGLLSDTRRFSGVSPSLFGRPPADLEKPVDLEQLRQQLTCQVTRQYQIFSGSGIALGVVFIILGAVVHVFPVPVTVLSLALYLGGVAASGYWMPETLFRGIIFKGIVLVVLIQAIVAANAYQESRRLADIELGFADPT